MPEPVRPRGLRRAVLGRLCALAACTGVLFASAPAAPVAAAVRNEESSAVSHVQAGEGGSSLEDAAAKAGNTARAVAMSMIGLALAVAATVLAFRRDFKEAAGVFAVGIVAVLLATPSGIGLLRDTVASLFGSP
jgi:hypothetical protein